LIKHQQHAGQAALPVSLPPLERFHTMLEVIDVFVEARRDVPAVARTSQARSRLAALGVGEPKVDEDSIEGSAVG